MTDKPCRYEAAAAVASAVERLVSVRHEPHGSLVTTSSMYPSGGSVTVWIRRQPPHFLVSDFGFGYQECSIMGADKSQFMRRAETVAEASGVRLTADGAFEVMVSEGQLPGAIKAVAACSQEVATTLKQHFVPRAEAEALRAENERLMEAFSKTTRFVEALCANDPDEPIADNGMTVLGALQFHAPQLARAARAALAKGEG